MNFANKVVLVTGGSSGIGAASAIHFARYGACLSLVGRDEERLKDVARQCQEPYGIPALCIKQDLTAEGACEKVIAMTVANFGRIDVLVNSAAKALMASLFDDTFEVFDELINMNLRVPYKLTRLAVPYLILSKGNVINLIATSSCRVRHGFLPFAISKTCLERFTELAAVELAPAGIRVNSIQPGITKTNLLKNVGMNDEESEVVYGELGTEIQIMDPNEIAEMIVFMASDICPSMNGVLIKLDAAQSLSFC